MNHLDMTDVGRQLRQMRASTRRAKQALDATKPHASWSKGQLWAHIQSLEAKLTGARRALTVLRNNEPDHFKSCEISNQLAKCEFTPAALGPR